MVRNNVNCVLVISIYLVSSIKYVSSERLEYKSDQLKSFSDLFQTSFGGKIRPFSDQITSENIEIRTSSISMCCKKIFFACLLDGKDLLLCVKQRKNAKIQTFETFSDLFRTHFR